MNTPDTQQLVDSLRSTVCPVCGGQKQPAQTLCRHHYFGLPAPLRQALYQRVHAGYEAAFANAMAHYEIDKPHWPDKAVGRAEPSE